MFNEKYYLKLPVFTVVFFLLNSVLAIMLIYPDLKTTSLSGFAIWMTISTIDVFGSILLAWRKINSTVRNAQDQDTFDNLFSKYCLHGLSIASIVTVLIYLIFS